jgi:hypothetical protein
MLSVRNLTEMMYHFSLVKFSACNRKLFINIVLKFLKRLLVALNIKDIYIKKFTNNQNKISW